MLVPGVCDAGVINGVAATEEEPLDEGYLNGVYAYCERGDLYTAP
jgi:hypothetical protein